jgi:hypothetical protein
LEPDPRPSAYLDDGNVVSVKDRASSVCTRGCAR